MDKMVLNNCKNRHTNLGMARIDYRRACAKIPDSWIFESLELLHVSQNIMQCIRKSMKNWNTKLTSSGEYLAKIHIRRDIFQENTIACCDLYDTPDPDIKKSLNQGIP